MRFIVLSSSFTQTFLYGGKIVCWLTLFFFSISSLRALPFSLLLRTHSPSTPAPGHLWERKARIPLRFHHWNRFSGAANRKFLYFCLFCAWGKTGVHFSVCVQKETQEQRNLHDPYLKLFMRTLPQIHLGLLGPEMVSLVQGRACCHKCQHPHPPHPTPSSTLDILSGTFKKKRVGDF